MSVVLRTNAVRVRVRATGLTFPGPGEELDVDGRGGGGVRRRVSGGGAEDAAEAQATRRLGWGVLLGRRVGEDGFGGAWAVLGLDRG